MSGDAVVKFAIVVGRPDIHWYILSLALNWSPKLRQVNHKNLDCFSITQKLKIQSSSFLGLHIFSSSHVVSLGTDRLIPEVGGGRAMWILWDCADSRRADDNVHLLLRL